MALTRILVFDENAWVALANDGEDADEPKALAVAEAAASAAASTDLASRAVDRIRPP